MNAYPQVIQKVIAEKDGFAFKKFQLEDYQTVEIIGWIFRIVLPYSSYKTQCLCV